MRKLLLGIVGIGIAVALVSGVLALNKRAEADRVRVQGAHTERTAESVRNQANDLTGQANEIDHRVGELKLRIANTKGDAANLANAFINTAAARYAVVDLVNRSVHDGPLTPEEAENLNAALDSLRSSALGIDVALSELQQGAGRISG